jgi:hypothetical protein
VTRHAKASSAGSTQRQATGLGRLFRAGLASRDASLRVDGSGAPSTVRRSLALAPVLAFAALLASALPALALAASSAPAAPPTVIIDPVSGTALAGLLFTVAAFGYSGGLA